MPACVRCVRDYSHKQREQGYTFGMLLILSIYGLVCLGGYLWGRLRPDRA